MQFARWILPAAAGLVLAFTGTSRAGDDCGCEARQSCGCDARHSSCVECRSCRPCKHHCRHCCECAPTSRSTTSRRVESVPRAAIVDSMPVFQMTPGVMAMPMMMAGFPMAGRALDTRDLAPPTRAVEQSCASSKGRLDDLEMQVDALNDRMKVIQRSVELQTRILEEIRTEFPRKPRPQSSSEDSKE